MRFARTTALHPLRIAAAAIGAKAVPFAKWHVTLPIMTLIPRNAARRRDFRPMLQPLSEHALLYLVISLFLNTY
jgi:hypothetical protein